MALSNAKVLIRTYKPHCAWLRLPDSAHPAKTLDPWPLTLFAECWHAVNKDTLLERVTPTSKFDSVAFKTQCISGCQGSNICEDIITCLLEMCMYRVSIHLQSAI